MYTQALNNLQLFFKLLSKIYFITEMYKMPILRTIFFYIKKIANAKYNYNKNVYLGTK